MAEYTKTYKISFYAELTEDDVRAMNGCFYDALDDSMEIHEHWGLELKECPDNTTYTVILYEKDDPKLAALHLTADLAMYEDKEEAIYFAAERGWDEVVNDKTGEVIWRNNYKGDV